MKLLYTYYDWYFIANLLWSTQLIGLGHYAQHSSYIMQSVFVEIEILVNARCALGAKCATVSTYD